VTATIREVAANAGALVRRVDDMLVDNRDTLKTTLGNLESFSATLARNSERLDRIMAGLENFTAGDVRSELLDTARSMRALTDNLDKRTAEISVGLTRFSNNGLREYEALAVDARRTIADLGRAIRNFDRNPQRVIFGPSSSDAQTPQPAAQPPRAAAPPRNRAAGAR
jgi:phospholipid/cholesterol/gamma-HCH transport system substrate-binding protein